MVIPDVAEYALVGSSLEEDTSQCPFCKEHHLVRFNDSRYVYRVECRICGSSWEEHLTISKIKNIYKGSGKRRVKPVLPPNEIVKDWL